MDEQILFHRFHEALETEPRPGAYERMRLAMSYNPIALKRRPAYRMRWTKMGLRIAAVATVVVIAMALIAVLLASHHAPVGSVPAGQDKNLKAYQVLMSSDYNAMASSTSNHCGTIQDTGCAAALVPIDAALQHWVDDLTAFHTPAQFAVLDGQLRRHLSEVIRELNAAVAFQKANNETGFDLAMGAATYERAWVDPTSFAIEGSYPRVAANYHDAVGLAKQSLNACVNGTPAPGDLACGALTSASVCTDATAQPCETDVQGAATQVQTFLVALVQNPAPAAMAAMDAALQSDLGQADTALLDITDALLAGDSGKVSAARSSYTAAITNAQGVTNTA